MTRPCCLDCSIPDGLPPRTPSTSSTPWPRSRVTYSVTARPSRQCTRGLTLCLSFQRARSSQHATLHAYAHPVLTPSHLAGCCQIVARPRRQHSPDAALHTCHACSMPVYTDRTHAGPCYSRLWCTWRMVPNLGLTRLDPGGLPGDWWIGTLPCTQEAGILCGMNDCGQRGIEGTAQAQRRLIQGIVTCVPILQSPCKQHSPQ